MSINRWEISIKMESEMRTSLQLQIELRVWYKVCESFCEQNNQKERQAVLQIAKSYNDNSSSKIDKTKYF